MKFNLSELKEYVDLEMFRSALGYVRDRTGDKSKKKWNRRENQYGYSWTECDPDYLFRRMEDDLHKLRSCVEHNGTVEEAVEHLADLHNFALMYIVRCYILALEANQEGDKDEL